MVNLCRYAFAFGLHEMRGHPGVAKQCVESGYEKLESLSFYAGVLLFVHLWLMQ